MKKIYKFENLDCPCCASKMQTAVLKIKGVNQASFNIMTQKLTLDVETENMDDVMKDILHACKKVERDFEIVR